MASSTRKIVIDIRVKGDKQADTVDTKTTTNEKDKTTDKSQGQLIKALIMNEALQVGKQALERVMEYSLGRRYSLMEDYIGEQSYKNSKVAISKVTGLITSVYAGFSAGGGFTPAGAVGAVVGAVSWGVGEAFSIYERQLDNNLTLNASRYNVGFYSQRNGLTDDGRGTEN